MAGEEQELEDRDGEPEAVVFLGPLQAAERARSLELGGLILRDPDVAGVELSGVADLETIAVDETDDRVCRNESDAVIHLADDMPFAASSSAINSSLNAAMAFNSVKGASPMELEVSSTRTQGHRGSGFPTKAPSSLLKGTPVVSSFRARMRKDSPA
jgi:hypothetical protein